LLEYDDWRSGSFEPLSDIPKDKGVVLGLISTKRTKLEPVEEVTRRIEEAARYFPRDQMGLSTQCGFGTVWEGNPIAPSVQEEKLRLVVETAHRAWG
jgi:5-methyltetrahydropteroyltriglutamate--homocysteine methyltransferase